MKTVDRKQLIDIIHKRFDGAVPKLVILDVINIINEYIMKLAENNEPFSIHNFGTLTPYVYHGHIGFNVNTEELQYVKPFNHIKFIPHQEFKETIDSYKEKLTEKN